MRGFYQFKDDNYYNRPVGDGSGLSIFPYQGLLNHIPYSMGIPIIRGRYSKCTLDGNNANQVLERPFLSPISHIQQSKGPLPYIYKLRMSGFTGKYSCNTSTCAQLNDRDFYLYAVDYDNTGNTVRWFGMFNNDTYPNGIYIRTPSDVNGVTTASDNYYDMFILTLYESLDTDVDKSYLILTLGNTANMGYVIRIGPQPTLVNTTLFPFLLYKEFNSGERIFALEESIQLTPTSYIPEAIVDVTNEDYIVDSNSEVCNFSSVTATLTPYTQDTYDIYNRHNAYGDVTNFGMTSDKYTYVPITTSSGVINVDKFYNTSNLRLLESPGAYKLTFSQVSTDNQGKHVPCETFFNREFLLKGYTSANTLIEDTAFLIDRNTLSYVYYWDNKIERRNISNESNPTQNNYIGLNAYNEAEPYLDNIVLSIAGSGGYLQLSLYNGTSQPGVDGALTFRHTYNVATPLRTTTFNSWTFHTDNSQLRDYCNFDSVQISLEPTGIFFQQGKKSVSCAPLCSDNTTPTSINLNVRISGYAQTVDGRFPYDKTFNLITDLYSDFFAANGDFSAYNTVSQPETEGFYYWCDDNGENRIILNLDGQTDFPTEVLHWTQSSVPGSSTFNGIVIDNGLNNFSRNEIYNMSGCTSRFDCALGIPFHGLYDSIDGINTVNLQLHCSGIATLDGFI